MVRMRAIITIESGNWTMVVTYIVDEAEEMVGSSSLVSVYGAVEEPRAEQLGSAAPAAVSRRACVVVVKSFSHVRHKVVVAHPAAAGHRHAEPKLAV